MSRQRILFMLSLSAALSICAQGCIVVPLGNVGGVDPAAQQQLTKEVPLYDSSKLVSGSYLKVGMITASGCDNPLLGGSGREEVVAKLRQQAQGMGANGITELSCDHTDPSGLPGCFAAISCSATALKMVSTGTKND